MLQECPITRPAYEDVLRRIEKLKEDHHSSNGSKEEEISYEEKLEVGKNIDMEEIEVGNDHHKNEEMAEKTKCSSPGGEIRVRNFALTNLGNIQMFFLHNYSQIMFYFLEATKANNNGSSRISKSSADSIDTNDDSDNVDTGDTEDTTDDSDNEDDEDVALNKNKPDTPATKDPQSKLGGAERGKSSMESLIGSVFIKGVNKILWNTIFRGAYKSHYPC